MQEGLIRDDGTPFPSGDLDAIKSDLDALDSKGREDGRNANSRAIASSNLSHMVIAAGPGTGKSFLFMDRISNWSSRYPGQAIYVSSFVRRLILDLQEKVSGSTDLDDDAKSCVTVSTLHTLARSIVERNGGTSTLPMKPHIQMVGPEWKESVWGDALALAKPGKGIASSEFESRFHSLEFTDEPPWPEVHEAYETLCQFYNALGFSDSIVLATQALKENPLLNEHSLWIFDEFQDFNLAEEELVRTCLNGVDGLLLAGDDDQAIYQTFKGSVPSIIRQWYGDPTVANAMLPLCGRSSFHICMAASGFLEQHRSTERIDKVYLPIDTDEASEHVQIVIATTPKRVTEHVREFIETHRSEIEERSTAIQNGDEEEPYLLILSQGGEEDVARYLGQDGSDLLDLVAEWQLEDNEPSADWKRVAHYYRHHKNPLQNFTLRKVLHLEGVSQGRVTDLLKAAIGSSLIGMTLEIVGVVGIGLTISVDRNPWWLAIPLIVYGLGVGFATAQLTNVVLEDVPGKLSGQASAMTSTFRQVGSALGAAIIGTVLFGLLSSNLSSALADEPSLSPEDQQRIVTEIRTTAGQAITQLDQKPKLAPVVRDAKLAYTDAAQVTAYTAAAFIACGLAASFALPNRRGEEDR